ncbi:inositol-pentakisphosphate 2-kinase-like isoform X1 [Cynara cardunculus var. scolymus]|uniref:inositol-pentakisphosphate 2-kinase-like isoform X1 n=1 Tax=Cynara cardunculus var. scolymus TaxID=59895 RepID=UPI000D630EA3|nr:inositol-pentakisphosphate 2-kinase-like isoform X1 [Cynara cardunculus var. scolymus]
MELILEAKDAEDWIYKGEGAVNLVLSYTGTSPNFIGKVLRVQKVKRNGSEYEKAPPALSKHECLVWKETRDLLSASTKDIGNHIYAQQVMCPLLGSQHIDAGVRVQVTREFLESIHNGVLFQRPSWRAEDARINTQCDSAILMSDHSIFPHVSVKGGVDEEELCIAVEIKPKCGFLPISRFVREENAAKKRISRFKLHQILKFHQRKISQISEYDPLDMFSASKGRVLKSVKDLFLTPQNNFRVFLNGSLVFGSLGGGADDTDTRIAEAFEDTLKDVIEGDEEGMRTPNFLQLVTEALSESGVMDRLLQVQKLDVLDIEGAIHAYYDVVSQPCVVCRELGEANRYEPIHSLPIDQRVKIVRDYLISSTAKDLSLIISFRPTGRGNPASPYDVVFLESINRSFEYKASFIDLDMKPVERMAYYYKLDQEIVGCYNRMMETVNRPGKSRVEPVENTSSA